MSTALDALDAAVEAAAKAWHERKFYESWDTDTSDAAKVAARIAVHPLIEAAAPHIAAAALRDAAEEFAVIPHPYEGGVTSWLRDRADRIEGGSDA